MRFLSTRCHLSREAFCGTPGILKWSSNICSSLHSSTFPSNHLRVSYYAGSAVLNTTHGTSHLILTEIFNQGIPMYLFQKCGNGRPERLNNMPRSHSSWMSELRLYTGPTLKYMSCCVNTCWAKPLTHMNHQRRSAPENLSTWRSDSNLHTDCILCRWPLNEWGTSLLLF